MKRPQPKTGKTVETERATAVQGWMLRTGTGAPEPAVREAETWGNMLAEWEVNCVFIVRAPASR